jgi:hypothetical protein
MSQPATNEEKLTVETSRNKGNIAPPAVMNTMLAKKTKKQEYSSNDRERGFTWTNVLSESVDSKSTLLRLRQHNGLTPSQHLNAFLQKLASLV